MPIFEKRVELGKTEPNREEVVAERNGGWPDTPEFRELNLRSGREEETDITAKDIEYLMRQDLIPFLRQAVVNGDFARVRAVIEKIGKKIDHKEEQYVKWWKDLGPNPDDQNQTAKTNRYLHDWREGKI